MVTKVPQKVLSNRYSYIKSKNPFLSSPRTIRDSQVTSFGEHNRDNFKVDLSSHNEETDLTERMKQMSVYDLYKMTKKSDTVLIDAFIK
jgi:hypothetical protein